MSGVQVSDDNQNEENVTDTPKTPEVQAQSTPEPEAPKQRRSRKPKTPEPGLGRTVLYVTVSETVRPAVISRVNDDESVDLTVFNSQGAVPVPNVRPAEYDPEVAMANTYHWPESN